MRGSDLEYGRRCHAQRRWAEAFDALSRADRSEPLAADDLERLGLSAALSGRDPEWLATLERLYRTYLEARQCARAARAAFWLATRLAALGEMGRAGGWLGRAERLVEDNDGDCVERGYLLVPATYRTATTGDGAQAHALAVRITEIGKSFCDADLMALGCYLQGRALAQQGRVAESLALLDEAMVATTTGELSPVITGIVYCGGIATCQKVYALERAREWTGALAEWCAAQPQLVTFTGSCLVHRAEVLQMEGAWAESFEEARKAEERFTGKPDPEAVADACYQQGEIHRLRGEYGEAERAYESASAHGREPQPGLALLRLAQGDRSTALSSVQRVLDGTKDMLTRARYLPACIEISLAAGELPRAQSALSELERVAESFDTQVLRAMTADCRGAVRLAEGDAGAALEPLRQALRAWLAIDAPYLAARTRVLLASACQALRDQDGVRLELAAARETFERLGATRDLARLLERGRRSSHGLTPRELEVLRHVARGETNKAIARELCLSEKTIDRHVSNIFEKTQVASRAAATAFAYENGLI